MLNLNKILVRSNVEIGELSTYKTQGRLKTVFYPKNKDETIAILDFLQHHNIAYFIIGNGSNLLINPETQKIAISTKYLQQIFSIRDNWINASCSIPLPLVYSKTKEKGLSGFEELASIPALIGGAIKNNASCFERSTFDFLYKITIIQDGEIKNLRKQDIIHSYHRTNLNNCFILSAKFKLPSDDKKSIEERFRCCITSRKQKQPFGFSCGSVFRNPPNYNAGLLIDRCNLKGKFRGDAIISTNHANFIINRSNATFNDVKYLIEYCKEEVYSKFGIQLREEVEIIE